MTSTLAQRIRHIRASLDLNQEEFGARLDVSKAAVSQWESEKSDKRTTPTLDKLLAIAALGDTTLNWLVDDQSQIGPLSTGEGTPLEAREPPPNAYRNNSARRLPSIAHDIAMVVSRYEGLTQRAAVDAIRYLLEEPSKPDRVGEVQRMLDQLQATHEAESVLGKPRPTG